MLTYRRFYPLSLAALALLSAYPLVNGVRIVAINLANGSITAGQYARYVIPYAAMCLAAVMFAALQPLLFKLKRFALPVGLAIAFVVFFAAEFYMESVKIQSYSLLSFDPATMSGTLVEEQATIDAWQYALCTVSPLTLGTQPTTSAIGNIFASGDNAYKIHYYLISLLLIAMTCFLVYGLGKMYRTGDRSRSGILLIRGLATAVLLVLCVFANLTAFFRRAGEIQTPLASILTCLFFFMLGITVGLYSGSFVRGRRIRPLVSSLAAFMAVTLMYAGEAAMMKGGLYRFGRGWFFEGLSGIAVAPADLLVIALSVISAWIITVKTVKLYNRDAVEPTAEA